MTTTRRVPSPSAPIADAGERDAFGLPPIAPSNVPATIPDHVLQQGRTERSAIREYQAVAHSNSIYPPKIAKAILAITREVGAVTKEGFNKFHSYNYQRWEDVLDALSPLLAKHGLIVSQSEQSRSLFENDQLVSITYTFSLISEDGDVWPEHPVWTAIARVRDSKGMTDDKAANKCHTQAHKYFLLHLFKIKTREAVEDDSDQDGGQVHQPTPPPRKPPVPSPSGKQPPHTIDRRGVRSVNEWAQQFMAAIAKAGAAEIDEWERLNAETIRLVAQKAPDVAQEIARAIATRRDELAPMTERTETAKPTPSVPMDPEAMLKAIEEIMSKSTAETFEDDFNNKCEPLLKDAFPMDRDAAYAIYRRHEARVAP